MHPVNVLVVIPVYVIISLSNFIIPYFFGNPPVPVGDFSVSTIIISVSNSISLSKNTESVWFVISSSLTYLSIFWIKSIGAPWNSWAR